MKNLILAHQGDEEIQKTFLNADLPTWEAELDMIRLEVNFFNTLLISDLLHILESDTEDTEYLNKNLLHFDTENDRFYQALLKFNLEMEKINECEDLHCDTYFLNEYAQFRIQIHKHFSEFRKLKTVVISYIHKGIIKYLAN